MAAQTEEQTVPAITYFPNKRDPTSGPNQMARNQTIPLPIKQRKMPKTKLPLLQSQTQLPGVPGHFKSMALKGSVCACIGTSVSLHTDHMEKSEDRVAYWQNVCMHLCATADITKTVLSYNKSKLKLKKRKRSFEVSMLLLISLSGNVCLEYCEQQRFLMSHWCSKSKTT